MNEFESRVATSVSEELRICPWYAAPSDHAGNYVRLLATADGSSFIDPWIRRHARGMLFSRDRYSYLFAECP